MLPAARQTVSMWSSRCAFSGAEGERYSGFWASLAEAPRGGGIGMVGEAYRSGGEKGLIYSTSHKLRHPRRAVRALPT